MTQIEEILRAVSEEVSGTATGDAVVGSPIQMGTVTVYPISAVSVGLGGGGGEGETAGNGGSKTEKGLGAASGGGAKARPVAVLVAGAGTGVKVIPLPQRRGAFERLLDKIPELAERFNKGAGCG